MGVSERKIEEKLQKRAKSPNVCWKTIAGKFGKPRFKADEGCLHLAQGKQLHTLHKAAPGARLGGHQKETRTELKALGHEPEPLSAPSTRAAKGRAEKKPRPSALVSIPPAASHLGGSAPGPALSLLHPRNIFHDPRVDPGCPHGSRPSQGPGAPPAPRCGSRGGAQTGEARFCQNISEKSS